MFALCSYMTLFLCNFDALCFFRIFILDTLRGEKTNKCFKLCFMEKSGEIKCEQGFLVQLWAVLYILKASMGEKWLRRLLDFGTSTKWRNVQARSKQKVSFPPHQSFFPSDIALSRSPWLSEFELIAVGLIASDLICRLLSLIQHARSYLHPHRPGRSPDR